jgi:hypothetical protein
MGQVDDGVDNACALRRTQASMSIFKVLPGVGAVKGPDTNVRDIRWFHHPCNDRNAANRSISFSTLS